VFCGLLLGGAGLSFGGAHPVNARDKIMAKLKQRINREKDVIIVSSILSCVFILLRLFKQKSIRKNLEA
jgi:hypothetical protein